MKLKDIFDKVYDKTEYYIDVSMLDSETKDKVKKILAKMRGATIQE